MVDIQNTADTREVPLEKVGVKNVKYPLQVLDKANSVQNTTASVNLFVNLPHNFKGTHMSRFIQVFHKYHKDISMNNFLDMLEEIRTKLDAQRAFGRITFPYFVEKLSPVTKSPGMMEYTCTYEGESSVLQDNAKDGNVKKNCDEENRKISESSDKKNPQEISREISQKFFVSIKVPIATLCPCSKAISEYGAHNQRGFVKVKILYSKFFWIEDVISMIEDCASTPLYSVLKRADEKFVTEHAYDNPRFVEDVVREVYLGLKKMGFEGFTVEAETEESIHFHNAYACAEM